MANDPCGAFKDLELIFEDDRIYYTYEHEGKVIHTGHVMMRWEDKIMKAHADIACHNTGDVLEIGFGMGISAGHIQANNPRSHTIIEIHPQVIEKAKEWAKNKQNVTIIEGDWENELPKLDKYDGVFFDNYGTSFIQFGKIVLNHVKPGAKVTFWNNSPSPDIIYHLFDKEVKLTPIEVSPDPNGYFTHNVYYLPEVQY